MCTKHTEQNLSLQCACRKIILCTKCICRMHTHCFCNPRRAQYKCLQYSAIAPHIFIMCIKYKCHITLHTCRTICIVYKAYIYNHMLTSQKHLQFGKMQRIFIKVEWLSAHACVRRVVYWATYLQRNECVAEHILSTFVIM